jgi:hypothetical protein
VLTVRAHSAASHAKKGWEKFTDDAISQLSQQRHGIVFLLWGRYAQVRVGGRRGPWAGGQGDFLLDGLSSCARLSSYASDLLPGVPVCLVRCRRRAR